MKIADLMTKDVATCKIRVDLNLAGKEVRDRWRRLDVRLQAAEARARATRRDGERSLATLVETAKKFRTDLRAQVAKAAKAETTARAR